ncbi:hypothetical protein BT69DRAFT_1330775 [Atractiella rhizophila]|nr:hypothetical protein BT69DRAFT_1330775 [Atractiella rhizophila]
MSLRPPLKRNQACSKCKERKIKCDGMRFSSPLYNPESVSHSIRFSVATVPACLACQRSAHNRGEDPTLVVCHYPDQTAIEAEYASRKGRKLKPRLYGAGESRDGSVELNNDRLAMLEARLCRLEKLNTDLMAALGRSASSSTTSTTNSSPEHFPTSLTSFPFPLHNPASFPSTSNSNSRQGSADPIDYSSLLKFEEEHCNFNANTTSIQNNLEPIFASNPNLEPLLAAHPSLEPILASNPNVIQSNWTEMLNMEPIVSAEPTKIGSDEQGLLDLLLSIQNQ